MSEYKEQRKEKQNRYVISISDPDKRAVSIITEVNPMKIKGVAHRGYPVKLPENTLSSYKAACDMSYTHLELDVHLSKDGVPVLMHDYSVDRLTNGKGLIKEHTLDELKRLKVKGVETIPTLEETLQELKGRISILVELKQAGNIYPGLEENTLDLIRKTGTLDQVRIIGFDHFSIAKMRQLDKDVRIGMICSGSMPYVFPFMKEIDCDFLGVNLRFMTPQYSDMIEGRGIISAPWPVDTLADMEMIADKYPNALITTNELDRWAEFYRNHLVLHEKF